MARSGKSSRTDLLVALAPASAHLLAAAVELVAAARSAMDALTEDDAGLPAKSVDALTSARASLDLLASLAATGAEAARAKARDTARREALAEILGALDTRAARLKGPAAEAFAAVRDAVASAAGTQRQGEKRQRPAKAARSERRPPARHERVKNPKAPKLRRIPIVLDPRDVEE